MREVLGDQWVRYTEHMYISRGGVVLTIKYLIDLLKGKWVEEKAEKMDT